MRRSLQREPRGVAAQWHVLRLGLQILGVVFMAIGPPLGAYIAVVRVTTEEQEHIGTLEKATVEMSHEVHELQQGVSDLKAADEKTAQEVHDLKERTMLVEEDLRDLITDIADENLKRNRRR